MFLNIDLKVSTNLIDPEHPVDLTPHEIDERTWGSKTILLVEQCMCAVQWGTKACLLLLYWRLTQNLKQSLIVKCAAVYVASTYIIMEIVSRIAISVSLPVPFHLFHGSKAMAALMLINRIFSCILLFGAVHSTTTGRHPPRINNATRHSIISLQTLYSTLQVMS